MKLNLEVNNITKSPVRDNFFVNVIQSSILSSGCDFLKNKNISVSLALVNQAEIRKINKKYRKIDVVTDILSFAEYKNKKEIKEFKGKELFLGELVLCYDDIKQYAEKERANLGEELAEVVAHGVLHLLGFQHNPKMFSLQKNCINKNNKNKNKRCYS